MHKPYLLTTHSSLAIPISDWRQAVDFPGYSGSVLHVQLAGQNVASICQKKYPKSKFRSQQLTEIGMKVYGV